jgi:putative ABC transport system permease protein
MIVAAPGSEITVMFAAVFLQATDMPLLDGETYADIATHPRVRFAAPIAFGDSHQGAPVVGTIPQFVDHLAGGLAEGRIFTGLEEAIAGARSPLQVGDRCTPAHGHGATAEDGAHGDFSYQVVGRMPLTGSPWDRALLVPVESVWDVHGLAVGHGPDWDGTLGPPFDPRYFPGTPAVLVQPDSLASAYGLRAQFSDTRTMAFFPGAVLGRLHALMGDIRQVMSALAVLTQVLVAAGSLAALMILSRLLARRFAVLRALGAPRRFVFALTWAYAASLICAGALAGLALGIAAAAAMSRVLSARTDILIEATIGWPEAHMVAGFVSVSLLLALLPAALAMRRPIAQDLRR